jgi:hypothetical protein
MMVEDSLGKKLARFYLMKNSLGSSCRWPISVILASWKSEIWRITVRGQPAQIVHKTPSAKWTGGVPQMVEYLFCKDEVLSSNPSPTKKTKNKRKTKTIWV